MESFYSIIALLTAGVALVTAIINLYFFWNKASESTNIIFGVMALSLFLFLMLPPIGFILNDKAPYSAQVDFKRIFIWLYYILLPWFFDSYSGQKRRILTISINILWIITYIVMVFTPGDNNRPIWLSVAMIPYALILYHGLIAGIQQIKTGEKKKGRWLLLGVSIYGILFILRAFDFFSDNYLSDLLTLPRFFPIHLHAILFMVIMGIGLRENAFEKYRLEKVLHWSDMSRNSTNKNR